MDTLVKLDGVPKDVLNLLVGRGYFKTKTEAIRAGILELGKEYNLIGQIRAVEEPKALAKLSKISKEIKEGKRKVFTEAEVKKKYGFQ